jgi:diguanylate cyclase (GGDEF)-like protein
MAPLAAATGGYVFVPAGPYRDGVFALLGLVCVVVALTGLLYHSPRRESGWWLVMAGFLGWVVGDALFSLQGLAGYEAYPGPADLAYLTAYGLMTVGLVLMVRRRGGRGDVAAVLDAAIVAAGVTVVAGVFVLAPIGADSSLSLLGKLTSAFYPIADILLLGILVRFWTAPSARTTAFRLLLTALALVFLGDVYYTATTTITGSTSSQLANDLVWFGGYICLAASTWDRSVHDLSEPAPGLEDVVVNPFRRLVVLSGGLVLPAVALLFDGLSDGPQYWPIVVGGSVALSLLVLARMAGLLNVVRAQAVQLAALARSDSLTGVANRRSWDHELSRACRVARERQQPLAVALLDLDHFKAYNDAHGHPAGDRLLKEATAAWSRHLRAGEVLARVGGEEFALLLPDHDGEATRSRVMDMMASTPRDQTFSAGVATWWDGIEPGTTVAAADRALYQAKRGGRKRVCVAPSAPAGLVLPTPRVVLQPILELETGLIVAVEALSRFPDSDPLPIFEQARALGRLAELEAAAISAARNVALPGLLLAVNVDIDSLAAPLVRAALSGDLTGLVLEITEQTDSPADGESLDAVQGAVREYRDRGALIAVDDWGTGYSDMDRLELLQPEIVKIDISIVRDLDSARHRALIGSVQSWAARRGALVCAEGIETEDQREWLRQFGVPLGQGFHLGRPQPASEPVSTSRSTSN